jgi:glutathionyl-hydroquinone reductase
MRKKAEEFYEIFKDHNEIFKNDKYHLYVSILKPFRFKPLIVTNFIDRNDFGDAVVSSGYIIL